VLFANDEMMKSIAKPALSLFRCKKKKTKWIEENKQARAENGSTVL